MCTKFWSRNVKGRDHSEDLGVDERILEWIVMEYVRKVWTGFIWLRIRTSGCCEHGNELSGSVIGREFLD
jgi:hypothetical protein